MRDFQRIESDDGRQITFRDAPSSGSILWGIPFVAGGGFVLFLTLYAGMPKVLAELSPGYTIKTLLLAAVGAMFLYVGISMAFLTTGTTLDAANGTVVDWWQVLWFKRETPYKVKDFNEVKVAYRKGNIHSSPYYAVALQGPNGVAVNISTTEELAEANNLARDVAEHLQLIPVLTEEST